MPKQQFNLNLSKSLITALKAKAESEGISDNELVAAAIAEYVGYTQPAHSAALEKRLVLIETRITSIEASVGELAA